MKHTLFFIIGTLALSGLTGGCARSGGTNANASANSGNPGAREVPAIEITAAALGKEWLADAAATDAKYKGKTLSITGELWLAQMIGDKAFVDVVGVATDPYDAKAKGMRVSCGTTPDRETTVLIKAREFNEKMVSENPKAKMPPQPTVTVKGVYSASTPADRPGPGIIDLEPCKVEPAYTK